MFDIGKKTAFRCWIVMLLFVVSSQLVAAELSLSPQEKEFVREHPVITSYNLPLWVPFNFYRNGKAQGFTIDYLELLGKKTGLTFKYESNYTWSEALERLKNKELDIIPNMSFLERRTDFMLFSKPILKYVPVVISRKSMFIDSLSDLNGKLIAVPKEYWYADALKEEFPEVHILTVDTNLEGLKAVAFGKADATIGNGAALEYVWLDNSLLNLKICCEADFVDKGKQYEHIGIRKDWEILRQILNKAIASVSFAEEVHIQRKWLLDEDRFADIGLSYDEKVFLKELGTIRVHNEKDWAPFNFFAAGKPQGYSIDLLGLLVRKLGIDIEYISGPKWADFIEMMQQKELDVIGNLIKTEDRSKYMSFTSPIFTENPALVSHIHTPVISLNDLKGKTLAIVKGFWHEEILSKNYPEIKLYLADNLLESLKAVAFDRADATVGNGPALHNLMLENNLTSMIKITGEAQIKGVDSYHVRIGVRKDWPLLQSALDKALASITYKELQELREKWLTYDSVRKNGLELSLKERIFLENHKVITAQNENDWRPFNFNDNGVPAGLSVDYFDLVAEKAGFFVEYIQGKNWHDYLQLLQNKELDVMLNIVKTPEREKFALFTEPYISNPNVIVSRKDEPLMSIAELRGKKVSTVRGFFYEEYLKNYFPDIELLLFDNVDECLRSVAFKKSDAVLAELAVVDYFIEKNFYTNLNVSGEVVISSDVDTANLRIGVREDMAILHSIIQKAMRAVSRTERLKLRNKWVYKDNFSESDQVEFTIAEKKYLRNIGSIKLCSVAKCNPYLEINRDGEYVGVVADFMNEFEGKLGIPLKLLPCNDWTAAAADLDFGRVEGVSVVNNSTVEEELVYTKPYLTDPMVIVALNDVYYLKGLKTLVGKTVAVAKECAYKEKIRETFPDIELVEAESVDDCLEMVSSGDVFATIGSLFVVSNMIQKYNISNVKIVGETGFSNKLRIGVAKQDTVLLGILNRVICNVDEKNRNQILSHWYKVSFNLETDWSVVWKIVAGAALIVLLLAISIIIKIRFARKLEYNNQELLVKNIELIEMREKLKEKNVLLGQLAVEDALTKLANRRRLDRVLYRELRRSQRFNHPFGIILLDIDKFKDVNDTYGHQVGDEVLIALGNILLEHSRETDIAGRWGGEEFMLICPEVTDNGMSFFAEELRLAVSDFIFPAGLHKTISIGVTISNQHDTIHSLVKRVDDALYKAKEGGRNKVTFII